MARIRDQAVVLRRWDFSETSQTAWLFAREHGLIHAIAKGAKRPKSAFSGGLEPLTRGEMIAIVKRSAQLATLTEWDLQEVFWGPRSSLAANRAGAFCAGLVSVAVTDQDPHPALWDALTDALRALEDETAIDRTLLRFQWRALEDTGHAPDLSARPGRAPVHGFDPAEGRLVEDPGPGAEVWRVRDETLGAVRAIASGDPAADATEDVVRGANRFLLACWRWTLGRELAFAEPVFGPSPPEATPGRRGSHPMR